MLLSCDDTSYLLLSCEAELKAEVRPPSQRRCDSEHIMSACLSTLRYRLSKHTHTHTQTPSNLILTHTHLDIPNNAQCTHTLCAHGMWCSFGSVMHISASVVQRDQDEALTRGNCNMQPVSDATLNSHLLSPIHPASPPHYCRLSIHLDRCRMPPSITH